MLNKLFAVGSFCQEKKLDNMFMSIIVYNSIYIYVYTYICDIYIYILCIKFPQCVDLAAQAVLSCALASPEWVRQPITKFTWRLARQANSDGL